MRILAAASLGLAWGLGLGAAGLPPTVASELGPLRVSEQTLQEATLGLAAARREALPAAAAVEEARADASTWWGGWLLKRRLAELKRRLDRVEAARQSQAQAHAALFSLLSGMEEELRGQLEGLSARSPEAAGWWRQEQDWRSRVESLEAGLELAPSAPPEQGRLLAEARRQQLRRDLLELDRLRRARALDPAQVSLDRSSLERSLARLDHPR